MVLRVDIPQFGLLQLDHAVFDVNGTLAVSGVAVPGVEERLRVLGRLVDIHLLTAGTHGGLDELKRVLGFPLRLVADGEEKRRYVAALGEDRVVALGNGRNDVAMLQLAALGIAVLGEEGVAVQAVQAADVLVRGPLAAIDLLLETKRLIATLRG